jgi:hypothetical protein
MELLAECRGIAVAGGDFEGVREEWGARIVASRLTDRINIAATKASRCCGSLAAAAAKR